MAKALVLSEEALATPVVQPRAAQAVSTANPRASSSTEGKEAAEGSASTAPNPHRGA